jgi:hypothetical protein
MQALDVLEPLTQRFGLRVQRSALKINGSGFKATWNPKR